MVRDDSDNDDVRDSLPYHKRNIYKPSSLCTHGHRNRLRKGQCKNLAQIHCPLMLPKNDHFESVVSCRLVTCDSPIVVQPRIHLGVGWRFAELDPSHQLTPVLLWSDLHSMSYLCLVIQDSKPILLANKNQRALIVLGTTHYTKFNQNKY